MNKKRTEFNVTGVGKISSIEEMAEKAGVSVSTILKRRGMGGTDDEIFNNNVYAIRVFDEVFFSLLDVKRHYKIKSKISRISRQLKLGASVDEIVVEHLYNQEPEYYIQWKPTAKARPVILEGKKYSTIQKGLEAYEGSGKVTVGYETIKKRLSYGWSDRNAFFAPNQKRK